jgi:hypothetical protein
LVLSRFRRYERGNGLVAGTAHFDSDFQLCAWRQALRGPGDGALLADRHLGAGHRVGDGDLLGLERPGKGDQRAEREASSHNWEYLFQYLLVR